MLLLATSAAKLNKHWLVPSGNVKIDQSSLSSGELKICALTFDDGPDRKYTEQVMDILDGYGIKATFFLVGNKIAAYRSQVLALHEGGHEIGNHTWSHPDMAQLGKGTQAAELEMATEALSALGIKPTWYRPPYGSFNSTSVRLASDRGMETVLWSVDPLDWTMPGASKIKQRVIKGTGPGGVVLLHSTHKQTVQALPGIIDSLIADGYTFVTMSQWAQLVGGKSAIEEIIPRVDTPAPQEFDLPTAPIPDTPMPAGLAGRKLSVYSNFNSAFADALGTERLASKIMQFDHAASGMLELPTSSIVDEPSDMSADEQVAITAAAEIFSTVSLQWQDMLEVQEAQASD